MQKPNFRLHKNILIIEGNWAGDMLNHIQNLSLKIASYDLSKISTIDGSNLGHMDTNGAWMIISLFKDQKLATIPALQNVSPQMIELWKRLTQLKDNEIKAKPRSLNPIAQLIVMIGYHISTFIKESSLVIAFIGHLLTTFGRLILNPKRIRLSAISAQINKVGFEAIGIVTLIAFSIAVVIGFLMITPLSSYGAENLTVQLVAIGMLQEMGVLLTAIMIAGRTGSAFAAELGVMNVNEETAALETLGMDVYEVLVIPRIIGVIVSICLLTIIADLAGLAADFIISTVILGDTSSSFINQIFSLNLGYDFMLGFVRAPLYGLVIGSIGCLRGLQVRHSAQEVGSNTTAAVVQSIFLVVFLHALFALSFQLIGIR